MLATHRVLNTLSAMVESVMHKESLRNLIKVKTACISRVTAVKCLA